MQRQPEGSQSVAKHRPYPMKELVPPARLGRAQHIMVPKAVLLRDARLHQFDHGVALLLLLDAEGHLRGCRQAGRVGGWGSAVVGLGEGLVHSSGPCVLLPGTDKHGSLPRHSPLPSLAGASKKGVPS